MNKPMNKRMNKPLLQLALDTFDLPSALAPLQRAAEHIDIIEVGTVLCLAEGMESLRVIRSLFPQKTILADLRIAEAGGIIARMAYEAGADWVSVVSGAAPATAAVVYEVAKAFAGDVQIELSDGWTWAQVQHWRAIGIEQVIIHRSRDAEAQQGKPSWSAADLATISRLADMGCRVTVTGGVSLDDIKTFAGIPVSIFISGRAICQAADPARAAAAFQREIARVYS